MGDNPKKKKLDGKRIAFKQKHEVDYLRKIAKQILNWPGAMYPSIAQPRRLAKAFLKLLDGQKKTKKELSLILMELKFVEKLTKFKLKENEKRIKNLERQHKKKLKASVKYVKKK